MTGTSQSHIVSAILARSVHNMLFILSCIRLENLSQMLVKLIIETEGPFYTYHNINPIIQYIVLAQN